MWRRTPADRPRHLSWFTGVAAALALTFLILLDTGELLLGRC